ncbi:hypothetical protein AAHC03_09449 [Spirometra sp. Aus1]
MGAFLDKPETKKLTASGKGNGISYGMSSMQGWRVEMEDAHVAVLELPGALSTWSFFGVFDGHAGAQVSSHCASNLLRHILDTPVFKDMVASSEKQHSIDEIKAAIVEGFLAFDASLLHDNPSEKSGSTAVVAFVTPKHIYFANCGDSRGILLRNSSPSFATEDHKPSSPGERRRINNAGGHVILSRVNGSLAVSRALGDFDYKQVKGTPPSDQLVSPEPDVTCLERMPEADQILCLACDGIWDVYSNEELCDYVLHRLKCSSSLTHVCNEVLDTSLFKGSKDNMSILLVGLNKLPEVDPEIVRQDEELEASIRQIIESTIEGAANSDTPLTSTYIANIVQSQVLPNYPPGGFVTKRAFVESICARHAQVSEWYVKSPV